MRWRRTNPFQVGSALGAVSAALACRMTETAVGYSRERGDLLRLGSA